MFDKLKSMIGLGAKATGEPMTLNKTDLKKLITNSAVVAGLAVLGYLSGEFTPDKLGAGGAAVAIWVIHLVTDYLNKLKADNS